MSKTTATPSTRRITTLFRTATPTEVVAGADWYRDAREIATSLATRNGVSVEIAAGVIAALSPLQSWGANVNLAARFLEAGGLHTGYLSAGLARARKILNGENILHTLRGKKITNFYLSIITAGQDGVCIDRHAWSLAVGVRYGVDAEAPNLTPKRYGQAVEAYTRAAKILSREYDESFSPAQVQAVTWTLWRRRFWAEGAFDGHSVG